MKKMTKWVAVFAACLMCSVPSTAAEGVQASEITHLSSAAVMQEAEYSDAIPVASEGETDSTISASKSAVKNGWYIYGAKKRYYKNGKYLTGMRKIHGDIYYFNPKGFMRTGWIIYNNKKYYFGSNGKRYSGVKKINGKYYYFSDKGVLRRTTVTEGKNTYYCTEHGVLEAQKIGGNYYYANGKKMDSAKAYEYETLLRARSVVAEITNANMSKSQKFETCFNWVIKHYYATRRVFMNQTAWPALYANDYLIPSGGGNCFSDGCAFAYLAKALGYKNVYVCVDTDELGDSGHCWAEIDGLVYDPLFAEAKNYYEYYGATYASYGLTAIRRVAI